MKRFCHCKLTKELTMSGTSTDNATSNCTVKIIQCMREREGPNQTFTGLDAQGHFEECALQ
jgi:hypothetical protein